MTTSGPLAELAAHERDGALVLDLLVQPRAARESVGPVHGDRLKLAISAPPVDGAANQAVIELLARAFAVPKAAVTIVRGHTGRRKTVAIAGASRATLARLLSAAR